MSTLNLSQTRIRHGVWEAIVTDDGARAGDPELTVTHMERVLGQADVTRSAAAPNTWTASFQIPAETLSDGLQSYLVVDSGDGGTVGSFAILAGEALSEDIRTEITLLRAELDMLKHAFRRHCVDTM